MAGDWIKMECSTPDKPEVLAITARMGWDDSDLTVGKLFKLWRWFDQHTTDGNAAGVTSALLDKQIGVTGFVTAVASVGWLTINEFGISLISFEKHNGTTAKTRAQTAKRVASHKSNAKGNAEGNAVTVTDALPREEKRREEYLDIDTTCLSPQQAVNLPADKVSMTCPQAKILELWAKHLPHLAQPRSWEGSRRVNLRNRWIQASKPSDYSPKGYADEAAGIDWWDSFFSYIANDTKLSNGFESNGRSWKPDLEWVVNASNFQKIIDGKYDK